MKKIVIADLEAAAAAVAAERVVPGVTVRRALLGNCWQVCNLLRGSGQSASTYLKESNGSRRIQDRPTATLVATRRQLHGIAECLFAGPEYQATGEIALR